MSGAALESRPMDERVWVIVTGVIAALVAVTVSVLLIAGDGSERDPKLIVHSVDRALEAGSARAIFSFTLDAPPGFEDRAVSFGGEGVFDFANNRSRVDLRLSEALGGDGNETAPPDQTEIEILVDAATTYVRMPLLTRAAGGAFEWFKIDVGDLTRVTGEGQLGLGASDPAQTLDYLRGAASDLVEIGDEPVGGVATTHYASTLDLTLAVELTPAGRREQVSAAVEQFRTQFGTTNFPVDVWIDEDGLPRRLRYELDLSAFDASGDVPAGAIMSFTMELFDYGTDASIEAPPADLVGDLSALLEEVAPTPAGPGT